MWDYYKKTAEQEMRPYVPGEDLTGISVNTEDTPELGGMIARNSDNHKDQWYVAKEFFEKNYKLVGEYCCECEQFVEHIQNHLPLGDRVICKICGLTVAEVVEDMRVPPD